MSPLDLAELETSARTTMAGDAWGYIQGGSGGETTLRANRQALDRLRIRPRFLVDVSTCNTATSLLGSPLTAPLGVAPMAYHRLAHPEGEVATAGAAGAAGALMMVSMMASRSLEDIAAATTGPLWLQVYWLRERQAMMDLIDRAAQAGFQAVVLTVDAPRVARRPRDIISGFTLPDDVSAVNLPSSLMTIAHQRHKGSSALERHSRAQFDSSITWADLAWLRARCPLPLVVKGLLTAEDAELAVAHDVAGVVVSNHGGRQLDCAVASADALPEIVDTVQGRCPVLVDGGIRRGSDVLKVLALGADLALLGRPVLWGLAHSGQQGVQDVLRLVREELEEAMVLSGVAEPTKVSRAAICRQPS